MSQYQRYKSGCFVLHSNSTSSFDSLFAGKINTGGVCKVKYFQTRGGRLNIKMTGKGDSVLVEPQ